MNFFEILLYFLSVSLATGFNDLLDPMFEKQIEKNIDGSLNVTYDCKGLKVSNSKKEGN